MNIIILLLAYYLFHPLALVQAMIPSDYNDHQRDLSRSSGSLHIETKNADYQDQRELSSSGSDSGSSDVSSSSSSDGGDDDYWHTNYWNSQYNSDSSSSSSN